MRSRTIAALGLAGAALLAACGSSTGTTRAGATPSVTPDTGMTNAVAVRPTQLGDVLVNGSGRTLYGFANDVNGTSTCSGSCATLWPAATASAGSQAGAGVTGTLHTVKRADGITQLAVGKWPLYTFSGDSVPGDVKGEGVGNFFVVHPDGTLLKNAPAPTPMTMPPAPNTPSGY